METKGTETNPNSLRDGENSKPITRDYILSALGELQKHILDCDEVNSEEHATIYGAIQKAIETLEGVEA